MASEPGKAPDLPSPPTPSPPSTPLAHAIAAALTLAGTFVVRAIVDGVHQSATIAVARWTGHATFYSTGLELLGVWQLLLVGVLLSGTSLAFLAYGRRRELPGWAGAAAAAGAVAAWRTVALAMGSGAGEIPLILPAAAFTGAFAGTVVGLHQGILQALDEGLVPGVGRSEPRPVAEWTEKQWGPAATTTAWATGIGAVVAALAEELVGTSPALEATIAGAIAGAIQLYRHREPLPAPGLWLAVTVAGWVAGVAATEALETALSRIQGLSFSGAEVLGGLVLGLCQWAVVRRRVTRSWYWIPMTTIVWSLVWNYASGLTHVVLHVVAEAAP